jgi:Yip1 domain
MDIVARAKGLIMRPEQEWQAIAAEPADTAGLFTGYAMPMAAIPAVAGFIGAALITSMMGGALGVPRVGLVALLLSSLVAYVLGLVGVYVLGKIIQALAPRFGGTGEEVPAMKLAVYSPTAAWLAGIFALIPPLAILGILGLYSLYLFYVGAAPVARVARDKTVVFTLVVILCAIVVNILIAAVTGSVLRV